MGNQEKTIIEIMILPVNEILLNITDWRNNPKHCMSQTNLQTGTTFMTVYWDSENGDSMHDGFIW